MVMNLIITFSKNFEFRRIKDTLSKMNWFKSNGYNPKLPRNIDLSSSDIQIKNQISKEFNLTIYESIEKKILSDFSKIFPEFETKIRDNFGNIPAHFEVVLTSYGTGGSYSPPNKIILNITNTNHIKTIVHEIIHLLIEKQIQKYGISHWQKERIVDLILNSNKFKFLNYNSWQKNNSSKETSLDTLFNQYFYTDRETFFSKIAQKH